MILNFNTFTFFAAGNYAVNIKTENDLVYALHNQQIDSGIVVFKNLEIEGTKEISQEIVRAFCESMWAKDILTVVFRFEKNFNKQKKDKIVSFCNACNKILKYKGCSVEEIKPNKQPNILVKQLSREEAEQIEKLQRMQQARDNQAKNKNIETKIPTIIPQQATQQPAAKGETTKDEQARIKGLIDYNVNRFNNRCPDIQAKLRSFETKLKEPLTSKMVDYINALPNFDFPKILGDLDLNEARNREFAVKLFRRFREILDHFTKGQDEVKKEIIKVLQLACTSGTFDISLLLHGQPGVGKTSLASGLAACILFVTLLVENGYDLDNQKLIEASINESDLTLVFADLGSTHDLQSLFGFASSYSNSGPGKLPLECEKSYQRLLFLRQEKKYGINWPQNLSTVLFFLDELDKFRGHVNGVNNSNKSEGYADILALVDNKKGIFEDKYLLIKVKSSRICYVATANSIEDIMPALLNRMLLVEVVGYSLEEKIGIMEEKLIPKIFNLYFQSFKIVKEGEWIITPVGKIHNDALKKIAILTKEEPGLRLVEDAVKSVLSQMLETFINTGEKSEVTAANLDKFLPSIFFKLNEEEWAVGTPGCTAWIYWTSQKSAGRKVLSSNFMIEGHGGGGSEVGLIPIYDQTENNYNRAVPQEAMTLLKSVFVHSSLKKLNLVSKLGMKKISLQGVICMDDTWYVYTAFVLSVISLIGNKNGSQPLKRNVALIGNINNKGKLIPAKEYTTKLQRYLTDDNIDTLIFPITKDAEKRVIIENVKRLANGRLIKVFFFEHIGEVVAEMFDFEEMKDLKRPAPIFVGSPAVIPAPAVLKPVPEAKIVEPKEENRSPNPQADKKVAPAANNSDKIPVPEQFNKIPGKNQIDEEQNIKNQPSQKQNKVDNKQSPNKVSPVPVEVIKPNQFNKKVDQKNLATEKNNENNGKEGKKEDELKEFANLDGPKPQKLPEEQISVNIFSQNQPKNGDNLGFGDNPSVAASEPQEHEMIEIPSIFDSKSSSSDKSSESGKDSSLESGFSDDSSNSSSIGSKNSSEKEDFDYSMVLVDESQIAETSELFDISATLSEGQRSTWLFFPGRTIDDVDPDSGKKFDESTFSKYKTFLQYELWKRNLFLSEKDTDPVTEKPFKSADYKKYKLFVKETMRSEAKYALWKSHPNLTEKHIDPYTPSPFSPAEFEEYRKFVADFFSEQKVHEIWEKYPYLEKDSINPVTNMPFTKKEFKEYLEFVVKNLWIKNPGKGINDINPATQEKFTKEEFKLYQKVLKDAFWINAKLNKNSINPVTQKIFTEKEFEEYKEFINSYYWSKQDVLSIDSENPVTEKKFTKEEYEQYIKFLKLNLWKKNLSLKENDINPVTKSVFTKAEYQEYLKFCQGVIWKKHLKLKKDDINPVTNNKFTKEEYQNYISFLESILWSDKSADNLKINDINPVTGKKFTNEEYSRYARKKKKKHPAGKNF